MKVATISFELQNTKMRLDGYRRVECIVNAITYCKPDLLVCSGYSVEIQEDIQSLVDLLREKQLNLFVLAEVKDDSSLDTNLPHIGNHQIYLVLPNYEVKLLGPQIFATSTALNGKDKLRLIKTFNSVLTNRSFQIGENNALVLCCGEINALQGRDNITYISSNVKEHIDFSDIILNPTHDCMANYGTLIAKRKFLSSRPRKNALYINSSNWNSLKMSSKGKIVSQKPSNSLIQNTYFNGIKIEMEKIINEDYLLSYCNIDI